jgi:hypothetical protein
MPLDIFDELGIINNAIHTYSPAYWDCYRRNVRRSVIEEHGKMFEIICQKNSVDCLCRVDEIHDRFQ